MAKVKLTINLGAVHRLRSRPDYQRNAARAVARRLYYRIRWTITKKPWLLKLGEDLDVLAPKGGAGALIYYLGYSEPETAAFVTRYLKRGMVFWDVGAHIGEYSLLAARQVGIDGRVEALEPQPEIRNYLQTNIHLNHFPNIRVHGYAASSHRGEGTLTLNSEPSTAHLSIGGQMPLSQSIRVPTISLDGLLRLTGTVPHLVKIDVEGAENLVLKGAGSLLSMTEHMSPVWIMEYSPENCAFNGYAAQSLIERFTAEGYRVYSLTPEGGLVHVKSDSPFGRSGNFVASKGELIV